MFASDATSSISCKIGWFISGDHKIASSRLQGFLIHEYLLSHGINSKIIGSDFNRLYEGYSMNTLRIAQKALHNNFNVIIFERPNWMMYKLSLWCRLCGIRTIAIRCDVIPGEYDRYFDSTIIPTRVLGEMLKIERAHVIEDMVEVPPQIFKSDYRKANGLTRVVWVGHGSYRSFITKFIKTLSTLDGIAGKFEFVTISNGDWPTFKWSLDTVYSHILNCDIAIIPMPTDGQFQAKSANRLSMMMALGMPVVASPITAYEAIAEDGCNCMLASSVEDFRDALLALENDVLRIRMGQRARKYAWQYFSPEIIGSKWIETIKIVMGTTVSTVFGTKFDRLVAAVLRF